jgi:hypothetical protein
MKMNSIFVQGPLFLSRSSFGISVINKKISLKVFYFISYYLFNGSIYKGSIVKDVVLQYNVYINTIYACLVF